MCPNTISRKAKVAAAFIIGIIIGIGLCLYVIFFTENLAITHSENALKALVDVNTALIGFLAVIAVFILTTNNTSIQAIETELKIAESEHERKVERFRTGPIHLPFGGRPTNEDLIEMENKEFEEKRKMLEFQKKKIKDKSKSSIRWLFISVLLFAISILLSLFALGHVETEIESYKLVVFFSLLFFSIGLVLILYGISTVQEE